MHTLGNFLHFCSFRVAKQRVCRKPFGKKHDKFIINANRNWFICDTRWRNKIRTNLISPVGILSYMAVDCKPVTRMYQTVCVNTFHTALLAFHTFPCKSLFYMKERYYLCSVNQTTKAYEIDKKHLSMAPQSEDQTAHCPSCPHLGVYMRGYRDSGYRLCTMRHIRAYCTLQANH